MYKLWETLFPEYTILIRDNQDMTMTVYTDMSTPIMLAQLVQYQYIIPKPMGVRFNYIFLEKYEYEVDDYHSGATAELFRIYFTDDDTPIITDADDHYAAAVGDLFREFFMEETDIITDVDDFFAAVASDLIREFFIEEADIITEGEDYHAVGVQELTREFFVAEGGDILTDTTDYNAIAVMTITREYIMEQKTIVTTAMIYNGGINHEKIKEAFTE